MKKHQKSLTSFTLRPSLFVIPFITVIVAALGSAFTTPGMPWYDTLIKPSWTPPGFVFTAVWLVIYFMTTISALITWNDVKRDHRFPVIIGFFLAVCALASSWSYVFFQAHLMAKAILVAAVLSVNVVVLMCLLWKRSRTASLLLLPFAAWSIFAIYLNYFVWRLNVYELITMMYGTIS